jgi:hypothetical protein
LSGDHVHRLGLAQPSVVDEPFQSERSWRVDEDDAIEVPAEVPLEEQGDVGDYDAVATLEGLTHHPVAHALDLRMHDRIEVLEFVRVREDDAA